MAITTLAGVINGLIPGYYRGKELFSMTGIAPFDIGSSWYNAGYPPAATPNTSGLSGQTVVSNPAGFIFPDPPSGNTYLAALVRCTNGSPTTAPQTSLYVIDRMWENSGLALNTTAAHTINSVAWPARDRNGSTNGDGVFFAAEVSGATTSFLGVTITISYTNSAGVAGRSASTSVTGLSNQGRFYIGTLDAGDVGIRSIQTATCSTASSTGTIHLVAFRVIALFDISQPTDMSVDTDAFSLGMPQLWNGTTLQTLSILSGTTGTDGGPMNVFFTQG